MPLPQDTCRLFWVATTLKVKQALRNHAARERCPPNPLNEPSDTSDANFAAARRLLQLRVLGFGLLHLGTSGKSEPQGYSTPLIAQMSPPCGRKRSNMTHLPSGDQTG